MRHAAGDLESDRTFHITHTAKRIQDSHLLKRKNRDFKLYRVLLYTRVTFHSWEISKVVNVSSDRKVAALSAEHRVVGRPSAKM